MTGHPASRRRHRLLTVLALALAQPLAPRPLAAQDQSDWLVAVLGTRFGLPVSETIENAMRDSDLDATAEWHLPAPWTRENLLNPMGHVARRLGERWAVAAELSHSGGRTEGGRQLPDGVRFIDIDYAVTVIGSKLQVRPTQSLRLAAGPAFYHMSVDCDRCDGAPADSRSSLGAIADVAVFIDAGPVQVIGIAQHRFAGSLSVGPYHVVDDPPFPMTDLEFDHWFVGAGIGYAF